MDQRIKNKLLRMIDKLPQADHISDERRSHWLDIMYKRDPERIEWHIERLRGFGGSEIGALVLGREGKKGRFHDARHILMQKLMIIPADPETYAMVMGTLGEQVVRNQFLDFCEGNSRVDLIHQFKGYVHKEHPWMRATPDDVVDIDSTLYLTDYKLPTEAVMDEYREQESIDFEYACQLTQGSIIGRDLGVNIDNSLLVNLDTKQRETGYLNIRELEFNAQLKEQIIEAGNHYFNLLLEGILPEPIKKPVVDLSTDPALKEAMDELAIALVLQREAKTQAEIVRAKVDTLIGDNQSEGAIKDGLVNLSVRKTIDNETLLKESARLGIKVEDFTETQEAINYKGLAAAVEEKMETDSSILYSASHTIQLPTGKKGDRIEKLNEIKASASDFYLRSKGTLIEEQASLLTDETAASKTPKSTSILALGSKKAAG